MLSVANLARSRAAEGLAHDLFGFGRVGVAGMVGLVVVRRAQNFHELSKRREIAFLLRGHDDGFDAVIARDEERIDGAHRGGPSRAQLGGSSKVGTSTIRRSRCISTILTRSAPSAPLS